MENTYDSTGLFAAELAAHFVSGVMMSPATEWMHLKFENEEHNKIEEAREWLEECNDLMLKAFARSNFYSEAAESVLDYIAFGSGSLFREEQPQSLFRPVKGFRGFLFSCDRIGRYVIGVGVDGSVDTEIRTFSMTARTAELKWGSENFPDEMKKALVNDIDKAFPILHSISPRAVGSIKDLRPTNKEMPYASVWVEKDSKTELFEGGYHEFPASVARYKVVPGELWGRGRGELAFSDIRTLNTLKEIYLQDLALKAKPPIMELSDSVIGERRIIPGGKIVVKSPRTGRVQDVFAPFMTGSNAPDVKDTIQGLQDSIKQIFFVQQILALLEVQKPEMTAYEFAQKLQLLYRLAGPAYGKLDRDFLAPVVESCFEMMLRRDAFPSPPEVLLETGAVIITYFSNPLSQAQQQGDVEAMSLAFQDLTPFAQMFPAIMDGWDPDKVFQKVTAIRRVPAFVTRGQDEVTKVREEREKQIAEEKQAQEMMMLARGGKDVGKMVKDMGGGAEQQEAV